MHALEPFDEQSEGTVFRDVVMLALAGFVAVVVLLLPHIARPGAADRTPFVPPGNLVVEVRWPDASDADVDLWVRAPGDRPVGYSNRGGRVFDLLRDDLGRRGDPGDLNLETAFARGAPAGAYTVNLHLYRLPIGEAEVPVDVAIRARPRGAEEPLEIARRRIVLTRQGEERTVLRFTLGPDGRPVAGSLHSLPEPLRNAREGRS